MTTYIITEGDTYDYYNIPKLEYAGNPPSGKENRRARRKQELRKRKGRL